MIKVNDGFKIQSPVSIDSRLVLSLEEMKNINENTQPDVYLAICKDDGLIYTYNKENDIDETSGKFKKLEVEGSLDYNDLENKPLSLSGNLVSISFSEPIDSGDDIVVEITNNQKGLTNIFDEKMLVRLNCNGTSIFAKADDTSYTIDGKEYWDCSFRKDDETIATLQWHVTDNETHFINNSDFVLSDCSLYYVIGDGTVTVNEYYKEFFNSLGGGIEVTQAEYDKLKEEGKLQKDVTYFVTDGGGDEPEPNKELNGNFIHLSIDDATYCIENLINKSYTSLWNEPLFGYLKELHDTYGAKFSLYVFVDTFKNMPEKYKSDFQSAKGWLKFGIHATNSTARFNKQPDTIGELKRYSYDGSKKLWESFCEKVMSVCGSADFIDRMPRLHYYSASISVLLGFKDARYGAFGFLGADDDRPDNYFIKGSGKALEYFEAMPDSIYNNDLGLTIYPTDFRADWFDPTFTSDYNYHEPTKSNVYDELVYRNSLPEYADTFKSLIWFAHEWRFYDGTDLNAYKSWFEDTCKFAKDYGYRFDFAENVESNSKGLRYNPACIFRARDLKDYVGQYTDWELVPLKMMIKYSNDPTTITEMPLLDCSQGGSSGKITGTSGRAAFSSIFAVPQKAGNKVRKLAIDKAKLAEAGFDELSIGMIEYDNDRVTGSSFNLTALTDKTINDSTIVADYIKEDQYKKAASQMWLYCSETLPPTSSGECLAYDSKNYYYTFYNDTKAFSLSLKKTGDGLTSFTLDELNTIRKLFSIVYIPD